ncbi:cyclin-F2-2-like [Lolium rigidum]|uniref:cyclin-F2-2-like n=1 Tax=Lolium rigidum TaxID=89674 RepID=UPI001F5C3B76|nr:cyclin-F2-2-like [Lolium rigidum]
MMQHAMDPWAFARPPPPGFGFSFARQPVADLPARLRPPPPVFVFSCAGKPVVDLLAARLRTPPPSIGFFCDQLPVDDVPARVLPPPPGFSRLCNKVLPPSPREIPVPPKFSKRAAPPVSTTVSDKPSAKRQRLCSDYEDDIEANLRRTERSPEERPRPDYMKTVQQGRVSPSDRARLVGWMDAFVRHHDLVDGTLHHAVAYVDRVLSVRAMNTHTDYELRLLGAAAVFVAAKYDDGWRTMPKLDPDKIVSYGKFASRKEVLDMERHMVAALGYQLGGPTAHTFVSRFSKHAQEGEEDLKKIQRMAHHLADESLRNYACLGYLPSVVASSAILLARFALNPPDVPAWSTEMQELTGYNVMNLAGCLHAMHSFSQSLLCDTHC